MPAPVPGTVSDLPAGPPGFVGRRCEVAAARRLLSRSPLVTLTGVGGVGKTWLALRLAGQVGRAFDEVRLSSWSSGPGARPVAEVLATDWGLPPTPRPAADTLVEHLADRQTLLVLDGCDPFVDELAGLAHTLLRRCPRLRILATSREPLGVSGEATLSVPPLPVPDPEPAGLGALSAVDAVALFTDRAAARSTGFALTEENRTAVARLCRHLDGLPLAIELAAAALPPLPPGAPLPVPDLLRQVRSGPGTVIAGRPAWHRTLDACFAASHARCAPDERALWARLATFEGSFTLEEAEEVCSGDGLDAQDLLDLVTSLVDRSVLLREEHGPVVRYRMLGTVRSFGHRCTDAPDGPDPVHRAGPEPTRHRRQHGYGETRRRHHEWCRRMLVQDAEGGTAAAAPPVAATATAAPPAAATPAGTDPGGPRDGRGHESWLERADRIRQDVRAAFESSLARPAEGCAALRLATAQVPHWLARGRFDEGRDVLGRALERCHRPGPERAEALLAAAELAGFQGDLAAARSLHRQGARLADQVDAGTGLVAYVAGWLDLFGGDPSAAARSLRRSRRAFASARDARRQAAALAGLAIADALRGAPAQVRAHRDTLRSITGGGDLVALPVAWPDWALGLALRRHPDPAAVRTDGRFAAPLEQALRTARDTGDPFGAALCLQVLAWDAAATHCYRRAALLLGAASGLTAGMGVPAVAFPTLRPDQERCERRARHGLGEAAFEPAFREGNGWGVDSALGYALGEPASVRRSRRTRTPVPATGLTPRELEVAELIGLGLTNRDIAARLTIARRTAEGHVESIMGKLGVTSRAQVAVWLTRQPPMPASS